MPKKFSPQTSVFVGITEEKALNEVAFTRHNLSSSNWSSPSDPIYGESNRWDGLSSEGQKIQMFIGPKINIQPITAPNPNLNYGSAYPKR